MDDYYYTCSKCGDTERWAPPSCSCGEEAEKAIQTKMVGATIVATIKPWKDGIVGPILHLRKGNEDFIIHPYGSFPECDTTRLWTDTVEMTLRDCIRAICEQKAVAEAHKDDRVMKAYDAWNLLVRTRQDEVRQEELYEVYLRTYEEVKAQIIGKAEAEAYAQARSLLKAKADAQA